MPSYTIVDHVPYHPDVEDWDYPKAGDHNPVVQLGIVRLKWRRDDLGRHRGVRPESAAHCRRRMVAG